MRSEVDLWWRQAQEDFTSAEANLTIKRYYLVVFLCQQAVEKGLKAYFFHKAKASPGQTHSLLYLATELKVPQQYFSFLRKLTPQFVNTRYPDAAYGIPSELYDEAMAKEYLEETRDMIQWLTSVINK